MDSSKASSYFINHRYDELKKRDTMQCKHCFKVLVDNKNSTGKVSHMKACRPDIALSNKVKGLRPIKELFSVEMASSSGSPSPSPPLTPKRDTAHKPLWANISKMVCFKQTIFEILAHNFSNPQKNNKRLILSIKLSFKFKLSKHRPLNLR